MTGRTKVHACCAALAIGTALSVLPIAFGVCRADSAPARSGRGADEGVTTYTIRGSAVQVSQADGSPSPASAEASQAPAPPRQAAASQPPIAGIDSFLRTYGRGKEPDRAMAELLEGVRRNTIRYDDPKKLERALHFVAQYYVEHPNDDEFTDLLLRMFDESRIKAIVGSFYTAAKDQEKSEKRQRDLGTLDSTQVKADQFMNLYRVAVKAEEKWWAPVLLSIRGIGSRAVPGDLMGYSLTASNRAGRTTVVPGNVVVEVIPPDAVEHDFAAKHVTAKRVGEFVLRASTPDGGLQAEHRVLVEAIVKAEPPAAVMTPEGGVFEVNQLVKLTVTANSTLQRDRWAVDYPRDLIHALKTYEDTGKVVMTIRGRRWGDGTLKVMSNNVELTRAKLYVLPPNPSKTVPAALTGAAIAAYATGVSAGADGHYTARRWLTFGVAPVLGLAAAYKWYQYVKAKKLRQQFLDQVPKDIVPKPPEVTAGAAPRSSGQE